MEKENAGGNMSISSQLVAPPLTSPRKYMCFCIYMTRLVKTYQIVVLVFTLRVSDHLSTHHYCAVW